MWSYECPTSMGNLTGTTVTCPFHVQSLTSPQERSSEPILTPSQETELTTWQKFFGNVDQLMAHIKTYVQITYESRVDGDGIKIRL
jgi:hypothetical protein